jgi:polar amino acid transport system substrate-binding protein
MPTPFDAIPLTDQARAQLTPEGVLRVGINMGNPLLVTARTAEGDPDGVAPDMARALAQRLGVPIRLIPFPGPGDVADGVGTWDIALIGAEPQRAQQIAFTTPYAQIEATYLVPAGSPLHALEDVDRPGICIAVSGRSAYGLWLERNVQHATLIRGDNPADAFNRFVEGHLDALASLRPSLIEDATRVPGSRVLDGHFATVQQAIGVARSAEAAAAFTQAFAETAVASGFVADLIATHGVTGRLAVASE